MPLDPKQVFAACNKHATSAALALDNAAETDDSNDIISFSLLSIAHSIASLESMLRASFEEDFVDNRG